MGQMVSRNNIYLSQELNLGNYLGLNLGANYDFNKKQTVKVAYDVNYRIPESRPDDFSQGFVKALIRGNDIPMERMETYQLSFGHIYNLRHDGSIRLKLSFGVGYSVIREPDDWQIAEEPSAAYGNYVWEYSKRNMTSLIVNPKIEVPLTSEYGVTFSPVVQVNNEIIYYGISFGQIIGLLN